jgi:hypothetical protein
VTDKDNHFPIHNIVPVDLNTCTRTKYWFIIKTQPVEVGLIFDVGKKVISIKQGKTGRITSLNELEHCLTSAFILEMFYCTVI